MAALLKGERYSVGQIKTAVTYYYDCSLRDGTLCQGSATLEPATSKGRVGAAEVAACSPAVKTSTCSGQISLAVASAVFYEKMLCQLSNLVQTREDAIALLSSLQSQLSGTGLILPADLTEVADVLAGGQCEQAAKILAGANGNSDILIYDYNTLINSKFDEIQQALINSSIRAIKFSKTKNTDEIMDDNNLDFCKYYPTFQEKNPVYLQLKSGYIPGTPLAKNEVVPGWYYLPADQTANVTAEVTPKSRLAGAAFSIFTKDVVELTQVNNNQNPVILTLAGINPGESAVLGKDKAAKDSLINGLNVIVCKQVSIRIKIYIVSDSAKKYSAPVVDRSAIQQYITAKFVTLNILTDVAFIDKIINYSKFDLNGNGQIDKLDGKLGDEADRFANYQIDADPDGFRIVLISLPVRRPGLAADQFVGGFAQTRFKLVNGRKENLEKIDYQYPNIPDNISIGTANGLITKTQLPSILAHELGHFVLGLGHPFPTYFPQPGIDIKNLMDYDLRPESEAIKPTLRQFRAYQVEYIEGKLK